MALNGKINAYESHGSKYFQRGLGDDQVYKDVRKVLSQIPESNKANCFIIGGIPFELAKQVRNGKERYTVLKAPQDYTANGEKQKAGLNIYKALADETGCKTFIFDWDDSRNLLNGAVSYHLPTHTLNAEAFSRLMVTLSLTGFFSLTTSLLPK